MQFIKSIIVAAAALAAVQAHAAYDFSFTQPVPAGSYAAPDFTNIAKSSVQTTSLTNVYMQPLGVDGSFLVVSNQNGLPDGSAKINTGVVGSYSFVWGSPDTFNFVDVYGQGGVFATTYTGSQLGAAHSFTANGDNANTGLFTITGTDGSVIDHLVLRSSGVAFEVAAPVPEPETYALMIAGLGALGFMARRRKAD